MSEFHLLRPWWLLAALPIAIIAWSVSRIGDPARSWRGLVAPHLLSRLLVGQTHRSVISPLKLLIVGWLIAVIALAGPTWAREPSPFADDLDVLAIVLKVTPSMTTQDIQPTRLARATQKIHDLLKLRTGAKTGLIAYSGSAHEAMPLTADAGIIDSFASELAPDVLPTTGDAAGAALALANKMVSDSGQRGWVLWLVDSVADDQQSALTNHSDAKGAPVRILAMTTPGTELGSLKLAATSLDAGLTIVTADDADVRQLASNTHFSAAADETEERWRDMGYWFVPLLTAICLIWFRPGWVVRGGV